MSDILYMQRALELAKKGQGSVSPNPMVGCVVVHDEEIIGEGYHQRYGGPHAEVNAINSVHDPSVLPSSTVYVTLEPCAHFGKTPPCADLLIEKKMKRVVIACEDPFEQVDGKGIQRLREAGIQTEVGLLSSDSIELNKRFYTYHQKKRPYVILKWAQTADGFIARENGESKWISGSRSRQLVHKWRTEEDGILIGKNTAAKDDPYLTSRDWAGKNPVRILLDSHLEIPETSNLFDGASDTLIINKIKVAHRKSNTWLKVKELSPVTILEELYRLKIQSLIIEGGTQVLNSFINSDCWDEARVFDSNLSFDQGISAPQLKASIQSQENLEQDLLTTYINAHG